MYFHTFVHTNWDLPCFSLTRGGVAAASATLTGALHGQPFSEDGLCMKTSGAPPASPIGKWRFWRFPWSWGYPQIDSVYFMENPSKMDDN